MAVVRCPSSAGAVPQPLGLSQRMRKMFGDVKGKVEGREKEGGRSRPTRLFACRGDDRVAGGERYLWDLPHRTMLLMPTSRSIVKTRTMIRQIWMGRPRQPRLDKPETPQYGWPSFRGSLGCWREGNRVISSGDKWQAKTGTTAAGCTNPHGPPWGADPQRVGLFSEAGQVAVKNPAAIKCGTEVPPRDFELLAPRPPSTSPIRDGERAK